MGPTRAAAPRSLRARLRTLEGPRFVDFCAGLWAARGYETRIEGERIVATQPGERIVVVALTRAGPVRRGLAAVRAHVSGPSTTPSGDRDVDVVAASVDTAWATRVAERHGAQFVGPDALANLLLYGISRRDADELTTRCLGEPTATLLAADDVPSTPISGGPVVDSTALVAVAGIVCLVIAATVGGVWTPTAGAGAATTPQQSVAGVDDPATETGVDRGPSPVGGDTPAENATDDPERYPPGVGNDSLDADALARAHASTAAERSYRLVVRQSGTDALDGSRRWNGAWQHAVVEDERTWLYSVIGYADAEGGSRLVQYTAYADGDVVYRRADTREGPRYDRSRLRITDPDGFGPHPDRTRTSLRRYLATTNVTVDHPAWNPDVFRLVATGRPTAVGGNVSNYTATALVAESGFVSELTVEYTRHEASGDRTVRFRFEYAAVGDTRIRQPGWYDEARTETAADASD